MIIISNPNQELEELQEKYERYSRLCQYFRRMAQLAPTPEEAEYYMYKANIVCTVMLELYKKLLKKMGKEEESEEA